MARVEPLMSQFNIMTGHMVPVQYSGGKVQINGWKEEGSNVPDVSFTLFFQTYNARPFTNYIWPCPP